MTKVTIDKETFKALASDARLEILKALDGRRMSLSEIARKTGLNKTTVLEHMNKLVQVDLVKKIEREGHKWTYYELTWKGSSLLHPDNTKIVITFCLSFLLLFIGIAQIIVYSNGFHIDISKEVYLSNPHKGLVGDIETNITEDTTNDSYSARAFVLDNFTIIPLSEKELRKMVESHTVLGQVCNTYFSYSWVLLDKGMTKENLGNTSSQLKQGDTLNGQILYIYLRVFFQDPFYMYCGIAFVSLSIVFSLVVFRKLWNRKQAL